MHILLLVVVIFLIYIVIDKIYDKKESYIQNGICDCCKCGFISCKECESKMTQCCGDNSFAFDRYTFNH